MQGVQYKGVPLKMVVGLMIKPSMISPKITKSSRVSHLSMGRRMAYYYPVFCISYVYHGRNIFSASVWPMREPKRAVPRVAIASKNPQTQGWRITSFLGLVLLV